MLNVSLSRLPWYGLAFGAILFVFAFGSAGAGHGTYLPSAIFAAPLSLVPLFGLFAAPALWGLMGWLVRNEQRWPAIIAISIHSFAVILLLVLGNPEEPGSEQWRYFWQAERVVGWWLWTGLAIYVVGLVSAWVLAIGPNRANRQVSSNSVDA